jgi:hypothetical protein
MRGGHVDAITRRAVAGWAADSDRPHEHLTVLVSVDGVLVGEAVADRLRRDLERLGRYGDGRHGFSFDFPEPLDGDNEHMILVRFAEDGARLPNGERRLPPLAELRPPVAAGPAAASPLATSPFSTPPLAASQSAASPLAALAPGSRPAGSRPAGADATPAAKRARRRSRTRGMTSILVTAPGRSGTTLLMGLLARSPAIVAAELVPYELRLLSYYSAAFQVLTAPADLEKSTHPDRLEGDGFHIGFNPFHAPQYLPAFRDRATLLEYYQTYVPERTLAFMREMVCGYYTRLAADKAKPDARYFAEKGNNLHAPTRAFTRRLFPDMRELVIVRDPRDVLCSHMAYFSSPPEKGFSQLTHAGRQLLAIAAAAQPDTHILKYEDMVAADPACFAAMSAFLDTPVEPETGARPGEVFRRHGTSISPAASVGRWRTNLSEALRARCASEWGVFLAAFGYDPA